MSNRSFAFAASRRRAALALLASTVLYVGAPLVATSSASASGVPQPVTASFGDCKNDNSGLHSGYSCPSTTNDGSGSGTDSSGTGPTMS